MFSLSHFKTVIQKAKQGSKIKWKKKTINIHGIKIQQNGTCRLCLNRDKSLKEFRKISYNENKINIKLNMTRQEWLSFWNCKMIWIKDDKHEQGREKCKKYILHFGIQAKK